MRSTPRSSHTPARPSNAGLRLAQNGRSASTLGPPRTPTARRYWIDSNPAHCPDGVEDALPVFEAGKDVSTRAASGKVLGALGALLPELWGGSADLAESNLTTIEGAASFIPSEHSTHEWTGNEYGRVLHFGIREHAMAAIINGIVLHGPTRAYGGTFLIFSDYMRPAVRLAALMAVPSIFVWTHDSVALGEDGPTHQPIEQLASLRAIPGLDVVRPADANEVCLGVEDDPRATQGTGGHRPQPPEPARVRTRRAARHPATPSPRHPVSAREPTCSPRRRTGRLT